MKKQETTEGFIISMKDFNNLTEKEYEDLMASGNPSKVKSWGIDELPVEKLVIFISAFSKFLESINKETNETARAIAEALKPSLAEMSKALNDNTLTDEEEIRIHESYKTACELINKTSERTFEVAKEQTKAVATVAVAGIAGATAVAIFKEIIKSIDKK